MRFQITHWHMLAPHDQFTVEVEAVDAAGADALAHEVAGFGHTYLVRPLPEPEPEPEPDPEPLPEVGPEVGPEDLVIEVVLDDPAPKPKRKRRVKSGVA